MKQQPYLPPVTVQEEAGDHADEEFVRCAHVDWRVNCCREATCEQERLLFAMLCLDHEMAFWAAYGVSSALSDRFNDVADVWDEESYQQRSARDEEARSKRRDAYARSKRAAKSRARKGPRSP
jgi:hypothetical protein